MFDGQLALELATYTTKHSVIRAFVGAALADYGKSEQHGNEQNHSR